MIETVVVEQTCNACGLTKSTGEFYRNRSYAAGYERRCKACRNAETTARHVAARTADPLYHTKKSSVWRHANPEKVRASHLRRVYGLTVDQYQAMLDAQDDACAICRSPFTKTPTVDHNHLTGKVRGLLCAGCNTMLGLARESVERLLDAAAYLERG